MEKYLTSLAATSHSRPDSLWPVKSPLAVSVAALQATQSAQAACVSATGQVNPATRPLPVRSR
jgi:hypothetical protein